MSEPRYGWWSYAKHMVRQYPELKKAYDDLRNQYTTADTTRIPSRGGAASRSTEIVAMRALPPARQAEYEAVTKAIEQTKRFKNGADRLALIDLVFWKQTHNTEGAAMVIGYSESSSRRFHREFLYLVGINRGLEDLENCQRKFISLKVLN